MENGNLIAAYSESGFKESWVSKRGLLISVTNEKCFGLIEPMKDAVCYDKDCIVFGNRELEIKCGSTFVRSKFGS